MRQVSSLADLSLSLRPAIRAPKGKKVVLSDFKSVENRVLFWLAGCEEGMRVYRTCECGYEFNPEQLKNKLACPTCGGFKKRDPYLDFASRLWEMPYEEISKEQRQIAKPGTLGCGFGLGGGKEVRYGKCTVKTCKWFQPVPLDSPDDIGECPKCHAQSFKLAPKLKTGLWRYAEMMGIDMTQQEASKQVNVFRDAFSEVCELWYWLEEAYVACVQTKRPQKVGVLQFLYKEPSFRIVLPVGRDLSYNLPFAFAGRDGGYKSVTLGFEGVKGSAWMRQTTYGGRLCENVVQAIGWDLLIDAMFLAEADEGLELVGHTHDEIICLADVNDRTAKDRLEEYMSRTPEWAPGLIMAADGFEGERYTKG